MSKYASKEKAQKVEEDPKNQIRTRYLLEVKAAYLEHYEEGLVAPDTLITLENSINEGLDHTDEPLSDWHVLAELYSQNGCFMRCGLRLQQWCCIGRFVEKYVFT